MVAPRGIKNEMSTFFTMEDIFVMEDILTIDEIFDEINKRTALVNKNEVEMVKFKKFVHPANKVVDYKFRGPLKEKN